MGKDHPIIFGVDMVKAILDGRKTMTRRVIKGSKWMNRWIEQAEALGVQGMDEALMNCALVQCPYGQVGDRLWVRETWAVEYVYDNHKPIDIPQRARVYYKTQDLRGVAFVGKWRPSIFMPRWASRLTLEITGVRVERLQEISIEDIKAEGIDVTYCGSEQWKVGFPHCDMAKLWGSLNAKRGYGWETNPWVWVIKFDNIGVRVK